MVSGNGNDQYTIELLTLPDQLRRGKTIHDRKGEVHQDYIWRLLHREVYSTSTVSSLKNDESVLLEFQTHEQTRVLDVFNQQRLSNLGNLDLP